MKVYEKCSKCGKKFILGDSIYEDGICFGCGGKGLAIAGIVPKRFIDDLKIKIMWCSLS